MGLIKEPKHVDLIIQSKPWKEEELAELSTIIQKAKKAKKARAKRKRTNRSKKAISLTDGESTSGYFAHETLVSLDAIAAIHTAKILQLAIAQFPQKKAPKERGERLEIVEQIEDKAGKIWEQLDQHEIIGANGT